MTPGAAPSVFSIGSDPPPADIGLLTRPTARYFEANPHGTAGNGSLMRTAPVALAGLGDDQRLADLAMRISALTHADPVAGEAYRVMRRVAFQRRSAARRSPTQPAVGTSAK